MIQLDGRTDPARILDMGWLRASAPAGEGRPPSNLDWRPAEPWPRGADTLDHWFRLDAALPGRAMLEFEGLATQTEVWVDGECRATHGTMFRPLFLRLPDTGASRLEVVARALVCPTVRPRPRWRNRLVPGEVLRGVRTSLDGRIAGTGEPLVGPYLPVRLHPAGFPHLRRVCARLEDGDGIVDIRLEGEDLSRGRFKVGVGTQAFVADETGLSASLKLSKPGLWWPHTQGAPVVHRLNVTFGDDLVLEMPSFGFRTVERWDGPGFGVVLNGVPVFCRGALWSGVGNSHAFWMKAKAAGMNMIRAPATAPAYQTAEIAAVCDAFGFMLWQDFMFARFDYPTGPEFLAEVRAEARQQLLSSASYASVTVLCGGDEMTQAAAMAGRPPEEWDQEVTKVLAEEAAALRPDALFVPNSPHGAALPFAATAPVAHYFGVGAYQRPVHEAAGVRFAAACLAFSNPPDAETCRTLSPTPGDAAWAATVPRDPAATWTFEDARDHYAATFFRVDMALLRRTDPDRWLAIGRAGVALAMQSALITWRADPACGGALVLGLDDTRPGPGWGLVDHAGRAKSALHAFAAVSQPIQVLLRDEKMDGVALYAFNETPQPVLARLVLRGLTPAGDAQELGQTQLTLPAHGNRRLTATEIMGRFVDLAGTWRFASAPYTVLGATLDCDTAHSTATLFIDPVLPRERLGLTSTADAEGLRIATTRFAQFVTIDAGLHEPGEDHFHLWPGETCLVPYRGDGPASGTASALNGLDPAHFRASA